MIPQQRVNVHDIRKTFELFFVPGACVELRVPNAGRQKTISGYFDDPERLTQAAAKLSGQVAGVYLTANPANPALLARANNKVVSFAKQTTADTDILSRRWLLLDFDPVRPSGISSTDTEKEAAFELARKVQDFLHGAGWPEPVLADSGNGAHLLYRIELPNDDRATNIVQSCINALAARFGNEKVSIDQAVYNAARIWKLYGTMSCKGDNTADRPHRLARLLQVPDPVEVVPEELLLELAAMCPRRQEPKPDKSTSTRDFDLARWIKEHNLPVRREKAWPGGGRVWVLNPCPFNPEHRDNSAYIVQFASGAIAAGCHHNGCAGKGWHDLRDVVEPGWREKARRQGEAEGQEKATAPEEEEKGQSQADILIELAQAATLFHDDLQEPFARVEIGGHWETWPVRSKVFRRWLAGQFYKRTGKGAGNDAISKALNVIEAKACFDGPEHKLNLRVAEHRGAFWYDLADAGWRAVKITPEGWQVVNMPPILFRRYTNVAPQVEPRPGGNLRKVLDFVNLQDDDDQVLLGVYLVTCLVPGIPHPVPVLHGEKGAAKSTALRVFRRLVDPARRELLTMPKDQNELALIMAHNYMPAFDNLDGLQPWQSDMLCCAATGGGISKRELYTNEDEVILDFLRCPTLDGINLVATRPDLLDRALIFGLERIEPEKRRPEAEFWAAFEQARPAIVGGMFDALARAMRIYPTVKLDRLPRMADFCRWGYAVAEALGIGGEKFLKAYYHNIGRANEEAISANPVAAAIVSLMQGRDTWTGTAAELLSRLEEVASSERINTKAKTWPQAANALTRRLKQVKSNLLDAGISYDIGRNSENRAVITLRRIPENTSGTSGTSGIQENQALAARRYSGDIPEIFKTSGETSGKPPAPEAYSDKPSGDTGDTGDIFGTSLGDDIDDLPF